MKITKAENAGTFEYQGDTFYKQKVELSDGTSGEVNAKSEGKWKVGDEVEVKSRKDTQYGTRLSLGKPNNFGSQGGGKKGAMSGYALSWAKKAVIAGKVELANIEEFAKELMGHAKSIGDNGSVVVSYANDLFCDGFFTREQILDAAKRFDDITKRLDS
jgi:hypothetical protein